jgi:hypothetical protein
MKLATLALATACALSGTAALAQSGTTYGQSVPPVGTVTAPSIGSYSWPSVGTTNAVPTWSNTAPGVRSGFASGAPTTGTATFGSGARR